MAGRWRGINKLWMFFINGVIAAAMVITLAMYASSNANEEHASNRNMLEEATVNISEQVQLYFINQHINLYNHHCYISPKQGGNLTYDEALTYLLKANSNDTVNYQVIDPATYDGISLIGGERVPVNYAFEDYASIRHACAAVREGNGPYDIIRSTSAFANPSNGAASSIALYTDIVVNMGERDKRYALFAVIEAENLIYSGLPSLPYEGAGACIIDKNSDYIVKDDITFRNSENFIKFLRVYNNLTYPQSDAVAADMLASGSGLLAYNDYRGEACYFPYHAIQGTDGWFYVASVPVKAMAVSNIDYVFTLILTLFLCALIAVNSLRMRYLNNLLRKNNSYLREARKAADAANEAKTLFLAHMSHEMRTPLNAIIGMGSLVRGMSNDPEAASLLSKMTSASEHLLGIISDVLDISKIGEGKLTLHNEPFSLEEMVAALSAIYEISAGERGVRLTFHTDIATNRAVIGDPLRLRQVMTNLISNAIKYNNPGGYAEVSITQLGDVKNERARFRFLVEDNGFGISPDKQQDVFEPFARDYTDNTKMISGTGLGLAISHELVTAMGGQINLRSVPGEGSAFSFELEFPLGEAVVHPKEGSAPKWNAESLKGLRILVVEDNSMNALIAERILRQAGAQVKLADNGRKAYDIMTAGPDGQFDIILMDILMPVMDGYEATRQIRALDSDYCKRIPILALSANAFRDDVEKSLSSGMQAHLVKPIDINALYQTIIDQTRGHSA